MAVRYYDEALVNKIRNWVIDPNMNIISPADTKQFFALNSDRSKDAPLKLPAIVLSRNNYCEIINPNKQALSYDGGHIKANEMKSAVLNAIPIKISYELSIYTRYFDEADEYARNFAFNLINYPSVDINIPYQGANIPHRSTIDLNNRITDNSNQTNRLAPDQYYRISLNFDINDAYLFSVPIMYNYDNSDDSDIYIYNDIADKIEGKI